MNTPSDFLTLSKKIQQDLVAYGFSCDRDSEKKSPLDLFNELITNKTLECYTVSRVDKHPKI